jgi:hypothetical protein
MGDLICRKHKPTPRDLAQIEDFKRYMQIVNQGQDEFHLSYRTAQGYAAMEVYGDPFCEGSRNED